MAITPNMSGALPQPPMSVAPNMSALPKASPSPISGRGSTLSAPQSPAISLPKPVQQPSENGNQFLPSILGIETAHAEEAPPISPVAPPKPSKPVINSDTVTEMRKTQVDQDIANQVYMSDPDFKALVDHLTPYMKQQGTMGRLPTFALNNYYKIDTTTKMDKGTAAMVKNIASPPPEQAPWMTSVANSLGNIAQYAGHVGSAIGQDVNDAANNLGETLTRAHGGIKDYRGPILQKTMEGPNLNPVQAVMAATGDLAGGAAKAISEPAAPVIGAVAAPIVQAIAPHLQGGADAYNSWKLDHPASAAALEGLFKTASLPIAMQGAESGLNATGKYVENVGARAASLGAKGMDVLGTGEAVAKIGTEAAASGQDPFIASIQPKLTTKLAQQMTERGALGIKEGSSLSGASLAETQGQKELADVVKTVPGYEPTATPIARSQAVVSDLSKTLKEGRQALAANDPVVPNQEVISSVKSNLESEGFDTTTGVGKRVLKATTDALEEGSNGKATGIWDSRTGLDQWAKENMGSSIFEKGSDNALALSTARDAMNGVIDKYAQGAGFDYAGLMDRSSKLFKVMDNLATHVDKTSLMSTVGKALQNKWVKLAGVAVGAHELNKYHLIP